MTEKKRLNFLDLLLRATVNGQPLTDDDIKEELVTFMFGGNDTSATTISFVLFALGNNQEVQERVHHHTRKLSILKINGLSTRITLSSFSYMDSIEIQNISLSPKNSSRKDFRRKTRYVILPFCHSVLALEIALVSPK